MTEVQVVEGAPNTNFVVLKQTFLKVVFLTFPVEVCI